MTEKYDLDEMIKDCEKHVTESNQICFGFGVGRISTFGMPRKMKKAMQKANDYIKELEGFCGIHPIDLWHNILIFDSLNNAKGGRNLLKFKGIDCGEIVPMVIDKIYIAKGKEFLAKQKGNKDVEKRTLDKSSRE